MPKRYSLNMSVVMILLILNGGIFLLELSAGRQLINIFGLWPMGVQEFGAAAPHFQIWQLITYSFLHGGILHLALNMYALWLFGSRMEYMWAPKAFAIYYFVQVMNAGYFVKVDSWLLGILGASNGGYLVHKQLISKLLNK